MTPPRRLRWSLAALASACALIGASAPATANATPAGEEHVTPSFSCSAVGFTFSDFPAAKVTVKEIVTVDGVHVYEGEYVFNGPSGANAVALNLASGHHSIDARTSWHVNGVHGDVDQKHAGGVNCPVHPGFSIEKLQRIDGSSGSFTTSPLVAKVGQRVDYEILVTNTGDVALTLVNFSDPHCDTATIAGGPGAGQLAPAQVATYTCSHALTASDQTAGEYRNTASVTANSNCNGEPSSTTKGSNTVVVTLPAPAPEPKSPKGGAAPEGSGSPAPQAPTTAPAGAPAAATAIAPAPSTSRGRSNVLGASAVAPTLRAPEGCVRPSFAASVSDVNVRSVAFYLDGHELKQLTARNAHGGRLYVTIDGGALTVGTHRLAAHITLAALTAAGTPAHVSRRVTVVRCASAARVPQFTG